MLSNIAAGSIEHKKLVYSSEAVPLLLHLLSTAPFDIRKEAAYVLGNLCVAPTEGPGKPSLITEHLVSLVGRGCLSGFIELIRSADTEAARLGLQFTELVSLSSKPTIRKSSEPFADEFTCFAIVTHYSEGQLTIWD